MAGVGVPGGPGHHGGNDRARRIAYRHSDAGRLARKFRLMNPETHARMQLRRQMKRKMQRGY